MSVFSKDKQVTIDPFQSMEDIIEKIHDERLSLRNFTETSGSSEGMEASVNPLEGMQAVIDRIGRDGEPSLRERYEQVINQPLQPLVALIPATNELAAATTIETDVQVIVRLIIQLIGLIIQLVGRIIQRFFGY